MSDEQIADMVRAGGGDEDQVQALLHNWKGLAELPPSNGNGNGHNASKSEHSGKRKPESAEDASYIWLPTNDVIEALHRGETGDAEIFTQLFRDCVCYDHSAKAWSLFTGNYWIADRTSAIISLVANDVAAQYLHAAAAKKRGRGEDSKKLAEELQQRANALRYRNRIANVLALAQAQVGLALTGEEWDSDGALRLGVDNGVIESQHGELRPGQPSDYIRTVAPTPWRGINTPAPRWEQFLREIFADNNELIAFLQRLLGYALTGRTSEHVLVVLHGEGRNGKDTLLETLAHVLGPGLAGPVSPDVLLDSDRNTNSPTPHLCALRGMRLVWVNETKEGARLNVSQVKNLTGGGTIVARPLYGAPVRFKPQYLLMLMTNHRPHASADDYALWQRILLVPFTQAFVADPKAENEHPRDLYLAEKLKAEAPGILAWLMRGCLEWQRTGLNPPKIVRKATDQYQEDEDTVGQFIAEQCITTKSDAKVKANDLYAAYKEWAEANGLHAMTGTAFGLRMTKRKFLKERKTGGMIYFGIGLNL